jgi:predicted nucleotidyltransferase
MSSLIKRLSDRSVLKHGELPYWMKDNVHYEILGGSHLYGMETADSDMDIIGFCIPTKDIIFPYNNGRLFGYDNVEDYKVWQRQHVVDKDKNREYDFQIYNIVHFVRLVVQNNPNMIATLFANRECIIHSSQAAEHMRDNRKKFLSKHCWTKYRGYSFSQLKQIKTRNPHGKRAELVEKFGYDCKYATHLVRLMLECQQIFETGDIDLMKDREMLKGIRRGEWSLERVEQFFADKEKYLESLYEKSDLPAEPQWEFGRKILFECLETHFGTLSKAEMELPDKYKSIVNEIKLLVAET